jgi:diguanylate cyclase (GGDEF)-like protein
MVTGLARALNERAWKDNLTGLPNRDWLLEQCPAELDHLTAAPRLAVLILDIDRFKDVNDTLGHEIGDQLLCEIAVRLRRSAGPTDRIARLGGDDFAVVLVGDRAAEAYRIAHRLHLDLTCDRVSLGRVDIDLEVTMGVAVGEGVASIPGVLEPSVTPTASQTAAPSGPRATAAPSGPIGSLERLRTLLRQGDIAMYSAKARQLDVGIYDPATDRNTIDRLGLLTDLREAL